MTFYTSLSGLQASTTDMSVISNNIANSSTAGFKQSRTQFADIMASSVESDPMMQVGSGVAVRSTAQEFGEGSLVSTGNALDLAITGDGFFAVKTPGAGTQTDFTRNGTFSVDQNGYVVDAEGNNLQVYPVDGSGATIATGLSGTQNLKLPATNGVPVATSNVTLSVNLDNASAAPSGTFSRFDPSTYSNSAQTTVYTAAGAPETMTSYFTKGATNADGSSSWTVTSYVGDQQLTSGGSPTVKLSFDANGKLSSPTGATSFDGFTPVGATSPQSLSLTFGSDTAATSSAFDVASSAQNGKAVGQLSGVTVDATGTVKAAYSNGNSQTLGQVVVANFTDTSGLRQLGSSDWSATGESGAPTLGTAGAGGLGNLMSGTIEQSNVDITTQLVDLISAQRNFQANSKALDTQNQNLDSIINIRA